MTSVDKRKCTGCGAWFADSGGVVPNAICPGCRGFEERQAAQKCSESGTESNDQWLANMAQATHENPKPPGLYGKYLIHKADGRPVDPDGVYFVLKLNSHDKDHAKASRRAALAYARAIMELGSEHPLAPLAKDLWSLVGELRSAECVADRERRRRRFGVCVGVCPKCGEVVIEPTEAECLNCGGALVFGGK